MRRVDILLRRDVGVLLLRPVLPRDVVVLLRCLVPSRCLVLRRDVDVAGVLLPNDSILRARFYLYIIYLSRPPKK